MFAARPETDNRLDKRKSLLESAHRRRGNCVRHYRCVLLGMYPSALRCSASARLRRRREFDVEGWAQRFDEDLRWHH